MASWAERRSGNDRRQIKRTDIEFERRKAEERRQIAEVALSETVEVKEGEVSKNNASADK